MSIIIGGPPSSGSSLLSVILNRHSTVACLQETHLLTKESLMANWTNNKKKILGGRLHSPGWHQYSKVDLPELESHNIQDLISQSGSLAEFTNLYFSNVAIQENKMIWAEKTPANIYFFHKHTAGFTDAKFILTIRHPYDIIASLIQRGKSLIDAVALCLLNIGVGYIQSLTINLHVIKYESVVTSPKQSVEAMCQELDIDFEQNMIRPKDLPTVKMDGWNHYEDGPIKKDSINRFKDLTAELQERVLDLCEHVVINPEHLKKYGLIIPASILENININHLILHYDYDKKEKHSSIAIKPKLVKDRLIRIIKSHPSSNPYPILYFESPTK